MMCTVAPELFELAEGPVAVATCGPAVGQTVIDRRPGVGASASGPAWASRPPVRYSVEVDSPGLLELFRSVF
jgi:inosine-uridine nucleoside N-ribohydrolase